MSITNEVAIYANVSMTMTNDGQRFPVLNVVTKGNDNRALTFGREDAASIGAALVKAAAQAEDFTWLAANQDRAMEQFGSPNQGGAER